MSVEFVRLYRNAADDDSMGVVKKSIVEIQKQGLSVENVPESSRGPFYDAVARELMNQSIKIGLTADQLSPAVRQLMSYCVSQAEKLNKEDNIDCEDPLGDLGVKFSEIAGQVDVKEEIEINYVYPFKYPSLFPSRSQGILLYGSPGSGKCLHPDEKVLMYDGSLRAARDILEDDILMGDDSTPRRVLSICSGRDQMYQIVPDSGESFIVNAPHILTLRRIGDESGESIRDIPLEVYMKKGESWRAQYEGFRVSVEWNRRHVTLDPYLFGTLLGHKCLNYSLSSRSNIFSSTHAAVASCSRIPCRYKVNSSDIRLNTLAGILDVAGSLDSMGYSLYCHHTGLFEDIIFIARSLGFCVDNYNGNNSDNQDDEDTEGSIRPFMVISGAELHKIPTRVCLYDAEVYESRKRNTGFSFEVLPLGRGRYCGFTIDGNHRFLLKDFTVTHNTMLARAATAMLGDRVAFYAPSPGDLRGKYEGETEKNIAKVFSCAQRELDTTSKEFAIIFIDEFDSLAGSGREDDTGMRRSVNALLQAMDGIKSQPDVSVIAATNYPDSIDRAVLRRFTTKIFVGQPDDEAREWLIRASISDNFSLPETDKKEARRQLIEGYNDDNKPVWNNSAFRNIEKYNNGACGVDIQSSTFSGTTERELFVSEEFVEELSGLLGPNAEGKSIIDKISNGGSYVNPDDYENKPPMFGYSASDITKMMNKAAQLASFRALRGAFRPEKFNGEIIYYVAASIDNPKARYVALQDTKDENPNKTLVSEDKSDRLLNFALCEGDIRLAMKQYPPTVDNPSYIRLLLYKNTGING